MADRTVKLDNVAILLAVDAGVSWYELPDYPGYSKGRWRDRARCLIRRGAPDARVVDGGVQWDGRMSDDIVRNFSTLEFHRLMEARKFSR
ncbi:hypothetical protein [Sphingomonas sp. SRS2]|uniref:hypothetical protein n=1 Tax=Sphingomonas sp. SRS2 TaxID=133190 RepID=UPI00061840D8|nr:hypothetical protein [Sphingomonas sp. SRS2]KKC27510.1 hypothetical protein WP12_02835 [Sphingomonas sp. SRS2]